MDSITHQVTLIPAPVAAFEVLPGTATCATQVVQFNDLSQTNGGGNIVGWLWNFGDPVSGSFNSSTSPSPSHVFATSGIYQVILKVTNANGCTHADTVPITINALPTANFTADTACAGSITQFTNTSLSPGSTITSYNWTFGDGGTSTLQSPLHGYATYGIYNATLTIINSNGCIHTVTKQVKVSPKPIPAFTFSAASCIGNPVCYTDLSFIPAGFSGYIDQWTWNFGDGSTKVISYPNSPNVCHTFLGNATSHVVRLIVRSTDGCVDSLEKVVNSIPSPIANFTHSNTTCLGQTVQFTDLSQTNGGGSIQNWNWTFGDPLSGANNVSTLQNPTHAFSGTGNFTVILSVTSTNGCIHADTMQVTINPLPVPDFTYTNACEGNPTSFTNTSVANAGATGSIISYSWNFGDGGTSTQQSPQNTYAAYGTYVVTLTVVNSNGCINTISKPVVVNPQPIAEFSFSAASCVGNPVNYTNLSYVPGGLTAYITTWQWDFGDGTVTPPINFPNNPNITHTFAGNAVSHVVRLTVTTTTGCTQFIEKTVNSVPSPVANFTYSTTNCVNQPLQFTDLTQTNGGGSIQSWSWNFGDPPSGTNNVSTLQNPIHSFSGTGQFTVILQVTSTSGCVHSDTTLITINGLPTANFTFTDACEGSPTVFTNTSIANAGATGSIIGYAWNFGDGGTSGLASPSHAYATYGNYVVTLTVTNSNGCTHTVTKPVVVNPKPVAEFSFSASACVGNPVNYTNQSFVPNGFSASINKWEWDFGDGSTIPPIIFPNNPNITHTFAGNATSHVVRLTVTTTTGCVSFIEKTVTSVPAPIANFSFPTVACENQPMQFTDLSQTNGGGSIQTWSWNFGDPASGANNTATIQSPVHQFTAASATPYNVRLVVTNGNGCKDTLITPVTIKARPVANFTADTVCLGTVTTFADNSTPSGSIASRSWDFGDGATATGPNPTHMYATAGNFNVTLTVSNTDGCQKDTLKPILVLGKPISAFSYSSPNCAGDSVQFNDQSSTVHGSIHQWVWDFGDGTTPVTVVFPANQNVKHKFVNGGNFPVKLTITTTDGCTAQKINTVSVGFHPLANFSFSTNECQGIPVQFTDLSQQNGGGAITSWSWNFGDLASGSNNTSTTQNPLHAFVTGGPHTVRLTVVNANGCIDSVAGGKVVTVNAAPLAKFHADTACMASLTTFHDLSTTTGGTITTWNWIFGDPASGTSNTSSLQNPTHNYSTQGTFNVTLTVTNSNQCHKDTTMQVVVNPKPLANFSFTAACQGSATHFTDLSTSPGSSVKSWFWKFGDGATDTVQNPTHTYATSGTFQVKLVIHNLFTCSDSVTIPVVVRTRPVANYTYTSYFCPSGKVDFQDVSTATGSAIVNRLWTFEPGANSTIANPTHTYIVTNKWDSVSLIVTDTYGCQDTIVDSIFVKPGFSFTFTNDTVCDGFPMHFSPINHAAGDTLYTLSWDFGDPGSIPNNTSNLYHPTHVFSHPGIFAVKLKAYNSDNCVDSLYRQVRVYDLPQPLFSYNSVPCDSVVTFSDTTQIVGDGPVASWIWKWGDGKPNDTIYAPGPGSTSHIYSTAGILYPVTMIITTVHGCSDSVTQQVQRKMCIQAGFAYADTLCARYKIAFADTSLPVTRINQWTWHWGDGTPDTTYTAHHTPIYHTYADSGNYNVTLTVNATVNGENITDVRAKTIRVNPTPKTYFANVPVCLHQFTLFRDTSKTWGEAVTKWNWVFSTKLNDGSTISNPPHKYDTAGIYNVKLVVVNRFGCKDSLTKPTRVYGLPQAHYTNTAACTGDPTFFTDKSIKSDTTLSLWRWNFGDISSNKDTASVANPNYRYPNTGDYSVRMIVKDHFGCIDTVDSTVTVNLTPTASFTVVNNYNDKQGQVKLNNLSTGATSYEWDFGNGKSSTDENPVATFSDDGTYSIKLISQTQFDCTDTTIYEYKLLFKGLYVPNAFAPTSTDLGVRLFQPVGVNLKQYHVMVFDIWGHMVWESTKLDDKGVPTEGWDGTFEGQLLPQGNYVWKISALFVDDSSWSGSDIGVGSSGNTMGSVALVR